jgi:hypothetical protein
MWVERGITIRNPRTPTHKETKMLTDKALQALQPRDKSYKVTDGQGLVVEVSPSGGKLWRLRYRWQGKAQALALGRYPDTKLAEARRKAAEARELLATGVNPNAARREARQRQEVGASNTFRVVFDEWKRHTWINKSEATQNKTEAFATQHVLPFLGDM